MKSCLTLLFCWVVQMGFAQVYLDQFSNTSPGFLGGPSSYVSTLANDEWTVNCTNTGPYDAFSYKLNDGAVGVTADATGNNKIYVRAKASSVGTQLRMDIQDAAGYLTSVPGITKTLTSDYLVIEYDFTSTGYVDGGYGGTACSSGPCPVDGTKASQLLFYVNPGQGGFNGSVVIDYISFGEEPNPVIMSDVFQDHFDMDSSINAFVFVGPGFTTALNGNSELVITGDGTTEPYGPLTYIFRNPATLIPTDIDVSGNNKLYVKIKSSVANTSFRIDLQDINDYLNTQGSVTKIIGTEYSILEYDFTGTYSDLGYGGSPCTAATAPCPVDPTRIKDMLFFVNPGTGMFLGEITIDYVSFGTSLEPPGPAAELVYGDHFNNNTLDWTSGTGGFTVEESGSDLKITGDGTAGAYAAISYILSDKTTGSDIFVDMTPSFNKVFLKAKAGSGSVPFRLDLVDSSGYTTSLPALTKVLSSEYDVYTFDFTAGYIDAGYGGTPCTVGPCVVDLKAIRQMLLYVDPNVGGYAGEVYIDYISIGKPLGADLGPTGVINYNDDMPDITSAYVTDMSGVVSGFASGLWTLTGNGTGGAYSPSVYTLHDETGTTILADAVVSSDKMYVRAKSTVDGTILRMDLKDSQGYLTNLNDKKATLTTSFATYEYNYAGAYLDGAYGGTPCTVQGCPVDGTRVSDIFAYLDPATGGFNGVVTIDWVAFGDPIVGVNDPIRLSSLKAYPNPVKDVLYLDYVTLQSGDASIQVMDALGKQVYSKQLGQQDVGAFNHQLDLSHLTKGMYFVVFSLDGAKSGALKFVK